ncbi:MAG: hypothetical protein Q8P56_01495 [Candidatus Uhrbacteria bacterium]|nr:hypothetical protein [Candidatus Uhrbacteria bacterium]
MSCSISSSDEPMSSGATPTDSRSWMMPQIFLVAISGLKHRLRISPIVLMWARMVCLLIEKSIIGAPIAEKRSVIEFAHLHRQRGGVIKAEGPGTVHEGRCRPESGEGSGVNRP